MANGGSTGKQDASRIAGLDALRGVAGLSVVVFHAFDVQASKHPWWMRFIGQGAEGVGLFFILSALTLGISWDHRRRQGESVGWGIFMVRRYWRIAPLFYVALGLAAFTTHGNPAFAPHQMAHDPFTWASLLAHVTFLFAWIPAYQNSWIGVGWSIGTEMSFYLLFPWIVRRVLPRVTPEGLIAVGLILVWAWPYLLTHLPGTTWAPWTGAFLFWSLPRQFIWFALGLWIWKRYTLWQPRHFLWAGLWVFLTVMVANHVWKNPATEMLVWFVPLGLLVWLVAHHLPMLAPISRSRLLAYLGKRSYSLYLFHWIILQAVVLRWLPHMHQAGPEGLWLRLAALLPLSVLFSELGYRFIEKPGMAYGKRWIEKHWQIPRRKTVEARGRQEQWGG